LFRRLKILQLINVRWYNACAHYAICLSGALQKRGHRVIVAGDPGSPPLIKASRMGLEVYPDLFLSYTSPWMIIYNIKRMVDLVRQEGIELVNPHRGEAHLVAALAKGFYRREVPLVRSRGAAWLPKNNVFSRYLNDRFTDKIITSSGFLKRGYLEKRHLPKEKVVNIPLGIDHDFFSPRADTDRWREKLGIKDRDLVVGILGRLSPVKGHQYFIKSAEHVLEKVPQTVFIICGEDAQLTARELKEQVKQMNMRERFRFLGRIKDVREMISLFDVGVISSVGSETICRVALEYMSMGKPVVGTRINAIPEVVEHGINGLVVEPGNSKKLADAVIELLEDEEKRGRYGENSRSLVKEKFTLDVFAKNTEAVYLGLLN
jgi:glycosyltransferase involved in cell wall biosynthesis